MTTSRRDGAASLIQTVRVEQPGVVRLAMVASPAVRVEAPLLRRLRLELLPDLDASVEADLWFSPLVQTAGRAGIELDADVANVLRRELAKQHDLLLRSRAEISRFHEALTPALRLEEEIIWYSIAGDETSRGRLDDALSRAVVAVVEGKREGVAMWAARALSELPDAAADSDFYWMLAWTSERLVGTPVHTDLRPSAEQVQRLSKLVDTPPRTVDIGVRREGGRLSVTRTPVAGGYAIAVPDSDPIALMVAWKGNRKPVRVTDKPWSATVGSSAVRITAADGTLYELPEDEAQLPADRPWQSLAAGLLESMTHNLGDIAGVPEDSADIRRDRTGLRDRWADMLADVARETGDSRFVQDLAYMICASGLLRTLLFAASYGTPLAQALQEVAGRLVRACSGSENGHSLDSRKFGAALRMIQGMEEAASTVRLGKGFSSQVELGFSGETPFPKLAMIIDIGPSEIRTIATEMRRSLESLLQMQGPALTGVGRRLLGLGEAGEIDAYVTDARWFSETHLVKVPVAAFLLRFRYALLLAPPGSGKTTAVAWMVRSLLRQAEGEGGPLPIVVRRQDMDAGIARFTVRGLLEGALQGMDYPLMPQALNSLLAFGQIILIIDGLDEFEPALRRSIAASLADFKSECPLCPILVTSRPAGDLAQLREHGFKSATFLVPSDKEIKGLVNARLKQWPSVWPEERELKTKPLVADLIRLTWLRERSSALVDSAIDVLAAVGGLIPGPLTVLMKKSVDFSITLSYPGTSHRNFVTEMGFLREIYVQIARTLDDSRRTRSSMREMFDIIHRLLADSGLSEAVLKEQLPSLDDWFRRRLLKQQDPVLGVDGKDHITFRHKLLMDYFAAIAATEGAQFLNTSNRTDPGAALEIEMATRMQENLRRYRGMQFDDILLAARTAAEKPARRSVPVILLAARSHLAQAEPERRASAPAVIDLLILYLSRVRDPLLFDALNACFEDAYVVGKGGKVLPSLFGRSSQRFDDAEAGLVADILSGSGGLFHLPGFRRFTEVVRRRRSGLPISFRNHRERLEVGTFDNSTSPLSNMSLGACLWWEPIVDCGRLINPLDDLANIAAASVGSPPVVAPWMILPFTELSDEIGRRLMGQAQPDPFLIPVASGTRIGPGLSELLTRRLGLRFSGEDLESALVDHLRLEDIGIEKLRGFAATLLMFSEVCDRERKALGGPARVEWPKQVDHDRLERHGRARFVASRLFDFLVERFAGLSDHDGGLGLTRLTEWANGTTSLTKG